MRKSLAIMSAGLLMSMLLGACSTEKIGDLGNKNIRTNETKYNAFDNVLRDKRFADDGMNEMNRVNGTAKNGNNLVGSHRNYKLEMSPTLADKVTRIEEVKSSYVMLADDNAYVAVSLDEHEPKGNAKMMSRSMIGKGGGQGADAGRRMLAMSTGEHLLTDELTNRVANTIRATRPAVKYVYVSANPEFVSRMNAYMNDTQLGYSVQHYVAEFNALAERVFPVRPKKDTGARSLDARSGRLLE